MKDKIKTGCIIMGPMFAEPVKVERVSKMMEFTEIVGVHIHSREHVEVMLSGEDLSKIKVLDNTIDCSAPAENVFLALEGKRFKYASLFDPLLAVHVSKIDPLPFQIDAVYEYVLKQPRVRFLIADDPGAGKTIMAGLVIKELKFRGLVRRILIVVPGHLKDQWRRELKEKFDEVFVVMNRETIHAHYGESPWEKNNQVITSIDFAKQEDILSVLQSTRWDLVVVDEAHKMSASRYGGKIEKTKRYKLGEALSQNSNHLLFLTATPHKGDPENFRLFLDLLMPGFFATSRMVEESLSNKDNPLFIRRLKEDLRDFEGKPIFTRRFPNTLKFRLSDTEKELYNELTRYVSEQYNKALEIIKKGKNNKKTKRNVAFALMILQRRMASSTFALLQSLKRRVKRLEKILSDNEENDNQALFYDYEALEEQEDLEENERWKRELNWETVSLAQSKAELKREIERLKELIARAKKVIDDEQEVKLVELKHAIEKGFKKIEEIDGNKKILIFTESKDTLQYLMEKIKEWGYSVNCIHGGMHIKERIDAEKEFRDNCQIMVATEAAGEGINLQFCQIMINYDIPWNPNRLEQRMGRIHRYGQQKDVYIFNLVAEDTREGQVLTKLFDKLSEIRNKLGSDRVFDIIGEVFQGRRLFQLIIEAVINAKSMDEILSELDFAPDQDYLHRIKEALGESLATRHIDYTRIREMALRAEEHRLVPEYVEEFFKKAFRKAQGKIQKHKETGFYSINYIPYAIKAIGQRESFRNTFGDLRDKYPKVTFDKELAFKNPTAEFVSFGHPLFEALLQWIDETFALEASKGAVFCDPSGTLDGYIWYFIAEVKDGKGEIAGRRLMALYQPADTNDNTTSQESKITELSPAILWDLAPHVATQIHTIFSDDTRILTEALKSANNYRTEILRERQRQAKIKKKYGLKSLKYIINQLDGEILKLEGRLKLGEKVQLPLRNKREDKKRYQRAYEELETEIEREQNLVLSKPILLTVIRVLPPESPMSESREIEAIGMEVAMQYERTNGRHPEDISNENLGFDIRSTGEDPNDVRYIEVKARADEGDIALTPNEWLNAKRFGDRYYLYIVLHAATKPELYIVHNPAAVLDPQEKIEIVRYIVPMAQYREKAKLV